jgi:hypothetical protein
VVYNCSTNTEEMLYLVAFLGAMKCDIPTACLLSGQQPVEKTSFLSGGQWSVKMKLRHV